MIEKAPSGKGRKKSRKKITPYEQALLDSVPPPEEYTDSGDRKLIEQFEALTPKQRLKVLKRMGVKEPNTFSITGEMRSKLASYVAETAFGLDKVEKGSSRHVIPTPTGSGKNR